MSNIIAPFCPTFSPYTYEGQFPFTNNEEHGFDSTLSPNMTRYLQSPTPSSIPEERSAEQEPVPHSYSHQLHSPTSFDMSNLSLRSPTTLLPQTQPIPISQPQFHAGGHAYASSTYGYSMATSSLPHRTQNHGHGHGHLPLYSPYSRPDAYHLPLRSPPSSSHSANSGLQSSELVSPMTLTSPMTDTSPLLNYYGQHLYGSPLHSYTGLQGMAPANQQPTGLLLENAHGGYNQYTHGAGLIPQNPPMMGSGGRGRGKSARGRGGGTKGVRKKGSREIQVVDLDKEAEGVSENDDDQDGEGDNILEDRSPGTHKSNLEKKRRSVLKQKFNNLTAQLPKLSDDSPRDTKLRTLDRAATYIEALKSSLAYHHQEVEKAQNQCEEERVQKIQAQALADDLARSLAQQTCKNCARYAREFNDDTNLNDL